LLGERHRNGKKKEMKLNKKELMTIAELVFQKREQTRKELYKLDKELFHNSAVVLETRIETLVNLEDKVYEMFEELRQERAK
jgi:hypothetical protein